MVTAVKYREMIPGDHQTLHKIWKNTAGLTIRKADSFEGFTAFLKRNPGLSFVVESQDRILGGILGGHDGRFGSIHHLVVLPEFRNQGIGKKLVSLSLERIESAGIEKCHIFINKDNRAGVNFWKNLDWVERIELTMASYIFDVN
ncbi:MAG: GNAT family N-acetyltransferase [Candidatus Marinimicrobia bacterium]|jgi:N-acetylglutamate synthase|nr:GNAT family N-acetyltransferase [Candidatus Neomarinimicrobiota bacterium]MBT4362455.1 GNAT family N-acetyltransferase [Candidatus Neomarinimicrobiota bacterium]MBT4714542.1 GNAT family N-acetyltransferase [Candidatus Neomarinimicrobiota bacterium]MBT4946581.1 GNAT family N-acetyltransferase [Candidatus Neomarinimicrobiota bacterium]MBT5270340.1 GNAT family N-acetyltransferase [Candidatus Neomarinimicrobiota bacterium]